MMAVPFAQDRHHKIGRNAYGNGFECCGWGPGIGEHIRGASRKYP